MCVVRQQDGESRSGLGSTTAATISMKHILGRVIDHVKAELGQDTVTLLDSSCGDMNWMPGFLRARPGDVLYTGLDIVAANIEASTADDQSVSQSVFTITEKFPTRAFFFSYYHFYISYTIKTLC